MESLRQCPGSRRHLSEHPEERNWVTGANKGVRIRFAKIFSEKYVRTLKGVNTVILF